MREFIKHIAISMREDDTWGIDGHWADNDKLGIRVWIANGFWFVHPEWSNQRRTYGGWDGYIKVSTSLLEKLYLWAAYKKLRARKKRGVHDLILESIVERRLSADK